jgi:hypothetical protein
MNVKKLTLWTAGALAVAGLVTFLVMWAHRWRPRTIVLQGAVIRDEKDPREQRPITDASVTASDGVSTQQAKTDASGYFILRLNEAVWPGQTLQLHFSRDGYASEDMAVTPGLRGASGKLYVAALKPLKPEENPTAGNKSILVGNVRVRYTVNIQGDENIGSAVKTFQVENGGNIPCNNQTPCSPDGNWKAATGSITLDAGAGNGFRNARASCIAGPCPFTRIDPSGFERGGQTITARALDWSDTATFLVEAEVFRMQISSSVRESYPVIFGRTLNFVLPSTEEGVSLEADLDRQPMVFPLGPELHLSWATCSGRTSRDSASSTVYRCELKPGYRF